MELTSLETVRFEQSGAVVTLTMDRPERRNALSPQLDDDLRTAFNAIADAVNQTPGGDATASGEGSGGGSGEAEPVRCVVLRGSGGSFCAGADLTVLKSEPTPEEMYEHLTERYLPLITSITSLSVPVLAGIEGTAAGAGMALALACDLRVMAEDAQMVAAFSHIGFVPDSGASYFLVRQVGYSRAFELLAESKPLPAERCLDLGLTNRVVPTGDLADACSDWAAELADRPTLALGLTKRALHYAEDHDLEDVVRFEAQMQKQTLQSDDHAEGLAAFLEKRQPNFQGQ